MTKTEFSSLIQHASHLCDDLLGSHPINERLLSSQAVLKEAQGFVKQHWPETFSEEAILMECSDEDLRQIQGRLMTALAILDSFTAELHRTHIESGK